MMSMNQNREIFTRIVVLTIILICGILILNHANKNDGKIIDAWKGCKQQVDINNNIECI